MKLAVFELVHKLAVDYCFSYLRDMLYKHLHLISTQVQVASEQDFEFVCVRENAGKMQH